MATQAEQLVDVVDAWDRVIGMARAAEVREMSVSFRVAHAVLLGEDGTVLLSQVPGGKRHAGQWGATVATLVHTRESYDAAIGRALHEELGIDGLDVRAVGKTQVREAGSASKWVTLYRANAAGAKLTPNPEDIAELRAWTQAEVQTARLFGGGQSFTPTLAHLFDAFWPALIAPFA